MNWWDSVTDFVGNHASDIISAGGNIYNQYNKDQQNSQYLDYLKAKEDQNYQDSVNAINAYNSQLGGGGNGAAAAAVTDANRIAALGKANAASQEAYKKILKMYKPLRKTVKKLLPGMTQTYQNSLALQGKLSDYVQTPEQVAKLDAAGPAWNVNVPLPDYVRLK